MKNVNEERFPKTYENKSLLSPDVITYCNSCHKEELEKVSACPNCGSTDVEHINTI